MGFISRRDAGKLLLAGCGHGLIRSSGTAGADGLGSTLAGIDSFGQNPMRSDLAAETTTGSFQPPRSIFSEPASVLCHQAACGALLRDGFDGPAIDSVLWNASSLDPGIHVELDHGELCIRGTSAEIPDSELHKNMGLLSRYAGVYSKIFPQVDAALAVRVRTPSGISSDYGAHVVNVHLCGLEPDCYSEVLFGKLEAESMEKITRDYQGINRPYKSARGWWFGITNQDPGRLWWRVSGQPLAERGDETERFYDVMVDYDEPTRLSRAFIRLGEEWSQLGETETVVRGITRIELKLTNVTPQHGTHREARFDDCRFYLNPRRNPIRMVVKAGSAPYTGERLRVELRTRDGLHKVSEGYTDQQGITLLSVDSPHWTVFPVPSSMRVFQGDKELARVAIDCRGIEGLYPGDVWVLDTSQIHSKTAG